ncbi:MAG: lytic transglycosylase domain-containing protein [Deltaproteobacteria bacterium]|nr:MAG: lytic transglycosylase domain-containing protein [Deltaproteobacteria bacterium]
MKRNPVLSLLVAVSLFGVGALAASNRSESGPEIPEPQILDTALLARPGAALKEALRARDSGNAVLANALFAAISKRHLLIADYADLYRIELKFANGQFRAAVELIEFWSHDASPLRSRVQALAGHAQAGLGDSVRARAAWQTALATEEQPLRRSLLQFEIGRSLLRSAAPEAAAAALLRVWTNHPLSKQESEVERLLTELELQFETPYLGAESWRKRGDVLFRRRQNEEALEAYEAALAVPEIDASTLGRVKSQRAHALFRLRRYADAAVAFAALPQTADNRISHARSIARAGDPAAAAAELERIATQERGSQGQRASFLAALLWDGEQAEEKADRLFQALANGPSGSSRARAARWRLGWAAYRRAEFVKAAQYLKQLTENEDDPLAGLRARYWYARSLERMGDEQAQLLFGRIAQEYPFSYYGWRAGTRASPADPEGPREPLDKGNAALAELELERPRILLEAGLVDEAQTELELLFARARGLDDRLLLADLFAEAGDYHRPQRLIVDAYKETLARGPSAPLELWRHAWPAPWSELVALATRERAELEPALVYAIMREESGYRPRVRSVSGARGLLQLMPETAERVARAIDLSSFEVDQLFDPNVNIELGAAYLHELLLRFDGNTAAAIGSYNAGPHRVVRWLEGTPVEDDEWVEAIPYDQTRGYVKRVLRSMHAYRVLY